MPRHQKSEPIGPKLTSSWPLSAAATLGSAVRTKGILLEVRSKLPVTMRKFLDVRPGELTLVVPETEQGAFDKISAIASKVLDSIESLDVIPREIQDILSITTTERHRWLKDGRLPSAGTRTVKLRGRARKITFHVFDPRRVEAILDEDLVTVWREQDAEARAENRRRAAWKAKLTREQKRRAVDKTDPKLSTGPGLVGWEEFERDGPI